MSPLDIVDDYYGRNIIDYFLGKVVKNKMDSKLGIDIEIPWCARCKGYTKYKTKRFKTEDGTHTEYNCEKCGNKMYSASCCKLNTKMAKVVGFLGPSFIIGLSIYMPKPFAEPLYISISFLVFVAVCFFQYRKYFKHLRAFNDWARTDRSRKSE
jgi:hypothetical protein